MFLRAAITRCFLALLVAFALPAVTRAQFAKLADAGKDLARKLKSRKPVLVGVTDFYSPDGGFSFQSHYLAAFVSAALQLYGKDHYRVAEHQSFDRDLARISPTPAPSWTTEAIHLASASLGPSIIVTGTLEKKDATFFVNLSAVRVSDGVVVETESVDMYFSSLIQ